MKKLFRAITAIIMAILLAFSPVSGSKTAKAVDQNGGVEQVTFEIYPETANLTEPFRDSDHLVNNLWQAVGKIISLEVGIRKRDSEKMTAWKNVAFKVYDQNGQLLGIEKGKSGRNYDCKYLGPYPNNQEYTIEVDTSTLPKNYHSWFNELGTGRPGEDLLKVDRRKAHQAKYQANGNKALAVTRFHMDVFNIIFAKNEKIAKNLYKMRPITDSDPRILYEDQDRVVGLNPEYKEGKDYFLKPIKIDKTMPELEPSELQTLRKNSLAMEDLGPMAYFREDQITPQDLSWISETNRRYKDQLKFREDVAGINSYNKVMTANSYIFYLNQVTALGQDISLNVGDKPKAEEGIKNRGDFPEGTKFKFKVEPDTSIPGVQKATVVITSKDGKETAEVEININVKPNVVPYNPREIERIGGDDRIDTAGEISKKYYSYADNVVVARKDQFPDALTASVLAKALNAPILLTDSNKLDARTAAEIKRLGAKNVYVIGGENAISSGVVGQLKALAKVTRIGGADRFETSALIAKKVVSLVGHTGKAMIATGSNFADSLSVSPYAAKMGYPILLVKHNQAPKVIKNAISDLGIKSVYILGGDMAVSYKVNKDLPKLIARIGGADRYETSAKIANMFFTNAKEAFMASGQVFADALVVGPVAANVDSPVLLTTANSLPKPIKKNIERADYKKIILIGLKNAISQEVEESLH